MYCTTDADGAVGTQSDRASQKIRQSAQGGEDKFLQQSVEIAEIDNSTFEGSTCIREISVLRKNNDRVIKK